VPPFVITIERGLEVMTDDEYLEITPKSVRLRKQHLTESGRAKAKTKSLDNTTRDLMEVRPLKPILRAFLN